MGLEIRLTGSVTLQGGCGELRQLSSAQAQVAMVRLTMERRAGTTRDQLADTLWPDGLPNTWASALRSVVSRVRAFVAAELPPGAVPLVAEAGRYLLCLPDDVIVDLELAESAVVEAKEALAAGSWDEARRLASTATNCLRAPFLPDHDGEWVTGVRDRLSDLLVTGLETASLASAAQGDHAVALGFANEAIRRAPLRESAHRCRMTAHVTAGNRAEALRTYHQLRRSLAEELGVDPAAETEAAYLDLLGAPGAAAGRVPVVGGSGGTGDGPDVGAGGAGPAAPLGPGSAVPFVGREAELGVLAGAWSRGQRGPSHMVLVTGEPGIGKTRLVTEAARRVAAAGGLVLCGRSDREVGGPCQPFVEALGGYLASTPADALPDLSPAARTALAHLVPALADAAPVAGSGSSGSGPGREDPSTSTGPAASSGRPAGGSPGPGPGPGPGRRGRGPGGPPFGRRPQECGGPWGRRRHGRPVAGTDGADPSATPPTRPPVTRGPGTTTRGAPATAPIGPASLADAQPAGASGPGVTGPEAGRRALVDALAEVMEKVAGDRPVLLVLDDVHVADRDTQLLLRRLARQCADAPLLIVATAADGMGPRAPFAATVHDLERDGWLQRLPLAGLGDADARALARHVLGRRPDRRPTIHRLVAETAGNAFLLLEQLRAQRDDGGARARPGHVPPAVLAYAADRADALDVDGRELLWAAVVAGRVFEPDLAEAAAGLAPGAALDALDAMLAAGLVTEVGADPARHAHRYRFRQEIVRRALYDQLSGTRRRRLHARLADAIERLRGADLGHYTPAVAHHRAAGALASGDRQAAHWGLAAAARARAGRAPQEAVRLYVQALEHLPPDDHALRAEALTELGMAQHDAGDPDCDRTLLDGAIQARRAGRLDIAARAALGLADVVASRPRLRGEAVALVEDVLAGAVPAQGPGRGAVDDLALGRLLARNTDLGGRARVGPAATRAAARALARELPRLAGPDHVARRLTLSSDLLTVASAAGDDACRIVAAHHQAMAAELTGDLGTRDGALATLASAVGETHMFGDALLADHAVAAAITQGRFAEAASTARLADALAGDEVDGITPNPGAMASRQMLVAAWLRGSGRSAGAIPSAPEHPAEEALAALTAGDGGRAHLTVRAWATGAEPLPLDDEWPHVVGVLALAAVELGDPTTAEAVRALLLPYAETTCGVGYRSFVGPAAFHLGRLAFVTGDWPEAERHLTTALRQLAARDARPWLGAARGARPWAALTQLALAAALDARGRPSDRRWVSILRADADWAVAKLGLRTRATAVAAPG